MRALQILMMVFCVNIGISIVNSTGMFTTATSNGQHVNISDSNSDMLTKVNFTSGDLKNASIVSDQDMQDTTSGSQSIWGVIDFFKTLLGMSVVPMFYLHAWGAPDVICNGWQAAITLLNGMAIAQYVRGISTKLMD